MLFGSGEIQPWNEVPVVEEITADDDVEKEKPQGTENAAYEGENKLENHK